MQREVLLRGMEVLAGGRKHRNQPHGTEDGHIGEKPLRELGTEGHFGYGLHNQENRLTLLLAA